MTRTEVDAIVAEIWCAHARFLLDLKAARSEEIRVRARAWMDTPLDELPALLRRQAE